MNLKSAAIPCNLFKEIKWQKNTIKNRWTTKFELTGCNLDEVNKLINWIKKNHKPYKFKRNLKDKIKDYCPFNIGNYYEIIKTAHGLNIDLHDSDYGWAFIEIGCFVDSISGDSKKGGETALKKLIEKIPNITNEATLNDEIYKEKARAFYHLEKNNLAFQGIPNSAVIFNSKVVNHVYSLDFHSAFPSALAEIRPKYADILNEWYKQRKLDPDIKLYMNSSIGAMANEHICKRLKLNGTLNKLRYEVLEHHANKMKKLCSELEKRGCTILNLRTDSIKFICPDKRKLIGLEGQGDGLGQWDYEFEDCKYRQFSTGKYQYIDNDGKVVCKVNGLTKLDRIKPRDKWTWEDLENCGSVTTYTITENLEIKEGILNE